MTKLMAREKLFINAWNVLAELAHENARNKGFWDERDQLCALAKKHSPELGKFADITIKALGVALEHSELSEALEGIRHGNPPDDKIPEFTAEEAESADAIIRIMDRGASKKLRIAEAVISKMKFNSTREYKHGKKA